MKKSKTIFDCLCDTCESRLQEMLEGNNELRASMGKPPRTKIEYINQYALGYEKERRKQKLRSKFNYLTENTKMTYEEIIKTELWQELKGIETKEDLYKQWEKEGVK